VFTRARKRPLSWARRLQSTPSDPFTLRSIQILSHTSTWFNLPNNFETRPYSMFSIFLITLPHPQVKPPRSSERLNLSPIQDALPAIRRVHKPKYLMCTEDGGGGCSPWPNWESRIVDYDERRTRPCPTWNSKPRPESFLGLRRIRILDPRERVAELWRPQGTNFLSLPLFGAGGERQPCDVTEA
jgi:hypothetical protein